MMMHGLLLLAGAVFGAAAGLGQSDGHDAVTLEGGDSRRLLMEEALQQSCGSAHARRRLLQERAASRRVERVEEIRAARGLLDAGGHRTDVDAPAALANPGLLFGDEVACMLQPASSEGPFYVAGEVIREDVREEQRGIDLYLQVQFIDVNTCQPVENLYMDMWHCNASGVYSGVSAQSTLDETYLRGLAATDSDGIANFTTIFPGYYPGRTHHIHITTSYNGNVLPNGTYVGSTFTHIGQLYFDQDLANSVEALGEPYSGDPEGSTKNDDDRTFTEAADSEFDSILKYALIGDNVSEGVLAWMTVGVDMSAEQEIRAGSVWTAEGGVPGTGWSSNPSGAASTPTGAASTPASGAEVRGSSWQAGGVVLVLGVLCSHLLWQ